MTEASTCDGVGGREARSANLGSDEAFVLGLVSRRTGS
jgi:hypothetical protein